MKKSADATAGKSNAAAKKPTATAEHSTVAQAEKQALILSLLSLDVNNDGRIIKKDMVTTLQQCGLNAEDPRLQSTYEALSKYGDDQAIEIAELSGKVRHNNGILTRALKGELILPRFSSFTDEIQEIFETVKKNKTGKVADYIPQLAKVDPEKMALSICTVDGQYYSTGDYRDYYCLQSTCKPLLYALALEENGEEKVHKHIGREPSGAKFNELALNNKGLPHNPMINAGAIMSCALIKPELNIAERFDYVMTRFQTMAGEHQTVGFDNSIYLSEKETGDRNFALGYFMKEQGAFPENTDLVKTLEFYFQCCSIETTVRGFSGIAATMANAGIHPLTGKKVFSPNSIKNCLSLMHTCGMYDYSGEWAFLVGLPAKSGVSGALQVIIPGVMGVSAWSPRLDEQGNSVRGVEFTKHLVDRFSFHNYDSLIKGNFGKQDPQSHVIESTVTDTLALLSAASIGDIGEIMYLAARGTDLNSADYDGRTALHLAASEGQIEALEYLLGKAVKHDPVDRWNNTPLDDAKREGHTEAERLLQSKLKKS